MHRSLASFAMALIFGVALAPAANAAPPTDEATIKSTIDAYVVANPMDFEGIDALVYRLRGVHIAVRAYGDNHDLTASEAAARVKAAADADTRAQAAQAAGSADSDIVILGGVPQIQRYITKIVIAGGVQFWGTWDFPDSWAGQGAPVDLATIPFSASSCTKTQNLAIWTYKMGGGSTGLGSLRGVHPGHDVMWNVADYTTNFVSMADRGTTRLEIVRTSACSPSKKYNIGAAFWYEANQGGSIASISVSLLGLSVTYQHPGVNQEFGTDATYQLI